MKHFILLTVSLAFGIVSGGCGENTPNDKDNTEKPYLNISFHDKTVSFEKGLFRVSITSNTAWEIGSKDTWLTPDKTSGEGKGIVAISYERAKENRKGSVRFTAEGTDPVELTITQNAGSVSKVALADPYIMFHDGMYYAYGTYSSNGIKVWTSEDAVEWTEARGNASEGLALYKNDVYGEKWFWAPEVYYLNGKFIMYFSAEERICAATSDSPLGPFAQKVKQPMSTDKGIDNTLFIDEDGKAYMYFCRYDGGLHINVAEMESDYMTMKAGTEKVCIRVSQEWEKVWPTVNEGAFVVKHEGVYYLTYSANSYESQFYGIGCATSTSPTGPWTKYDNNPLLQKPAGLVGVGHSAMFRGTDGKLKIVFHAHHSGQSINPREMYISDVGFTLSNGKYVMEIDPAYVTAVTRH